MTETRIERFDHATIAVRELDAAVAAYRTLLGAEPTFVGADPELGVQSAVFGLGNALVELVAPEPSAPEAEGLRALLAASGEDEGIFLLSPDSGAKPGMKVS